MVLLCVPGASLPAQPKGFPSAKTPVPSTVHSLRLRCAAAAGDNGATLAKTDQNHNVPPNLLTRTSPSSPPSVRPVPVPVPTPTTLGRSSFPAGFSFGAASSCYQIEGATNEGGRGPCIWDTFVQQFPEKIADGSNANTACNSYYRYADDVKLLKDMGVDVYRFSISWSRILPGGSLKNGINKEGINYYNKLIDELVSNGIKPFVTLFHWDFPQALEDEYMGLLDRRIVEDFNDYCEICFREFGDRVKHWITVNEPCNFTLFGYNSGIFAPGRCSPSLGCPAGDSATEPYIVTHNIILCHAAAYRLYEKKFKATQNGEVGITLNYTWSMPHSNSKQDINAAKRLTDFMFGWYMDPIVFGDYPFIMRALVRERLPIFTTEESKLVKGSYDFIGINYYTSKYAYGDPFSPNSLGIDYMKDTFVETTDNKEGVLIGGKTSLTGNYVVPEGILDFLVYTMKNYKNPPIYVTENGIGDLDNHHLLFKEALDDQDRIQYYSRHLAKVLEAIRLGVNVKGFMAWSLMDNWEWTAGYIVRYGLSYVDYTDRQNRFPKASSQWFSKFLSS